MADKTEKALETILGILTVAQQALPIVHEMVMTNSWSKRTAELYRTLLEHRPNLTPEQAMKAALFAADEFEKDGKERAKRALELIASVEAKMKTES